MRDPSMNQDKSARVLNGLERIVLAFVCLLGGMLACIFLCSAWPENIFHAWWAYVGCFSFPCLAFSVVFACLYGFFYLVVWITSAFVGKNFIATRKRKIMIRSLVWCLIPLLVGGFCFLIKDIKAPKGPWILVDEGDDG